MEEVKKPTEQVVVDKDKLEQLRNTLLDIQSNLQLLEEKCEELKK